MRHFILGNNHKYFKSIYKYEEDLTKIFKTHYKEIISQKSVFVPTAKQFKTKNYKNSICDGFLLVWENPTTPLLYITEIELEKHSIDKHILPQIGDFISFIKSASSGDLTELRGFLYEKLKQDKVLFKQIQEDTDREVYELIDNALEDLQVLLIIDRMNPNLSIGLTQIEKAINLKIRKIEVSKFEAKDTNEIISYSDSEAELSDNLKTTNGNEDDENTTDEFTLAYHLKDKSDNIQKIVNEFINRTKSQIVVLPKKHYIGYFKDNKMIMSTVVRNKNAIFYSKALIKDSDKKFDKLNFRDVRNIGHYTNHLPTEIVISSADSLDQLIEYFNKIIGKFQ
jgi:predicted transport protein